MVTAITKSLLITLFCAAVIGCGSANLNCSDQRVTDLVTQIARREMVKAATPWASDQGFDIPNTQITLEGIRTRTDNERDAECAAAIKFNIAISERILSPRLENMPFRQPPPGHFSCPPYSANTAGIAGAFSSARTVHSTQILAFMSVSLCRVHLRWLAGALGIERLRWPITLSSHEAEAAKAGMPIPCNDHMVVDSDTKEPAHLDDLLGHVDVGA
jgi:hypothetical protein